VIARKFPPHPAFFPVPMRDPADFGTGLRAHLQLAPLVEPAGEQPEEVVDAVDAAEAELEERLDLLAVAHAALEDRERALAEREAALEYEASRLDAMRGELSAAGPGTDARTILRERAEQHAELLWRIFEDALGAPDHGTRLAAVRALLTEAYREAR
jgi:hypothetical protein